MKPRLSVVITSFNRPNFLLRAVKFLLSYKLPIQLIILDSSSKKIENIEFNNLVTEYNIIVKKFDTDIFVTEKIARGCDFINTDYSVICPDDDFFSTASLLKCVDFLDVNPDYSSAHGLHFCHTSYEKTIKNGFNLFQLYYKGKSIIDEKSSDRINKYLTGESHYHPFYAVHKTKDFKLIWKNINLFVDDWSLSEYFPSCLSLILGKMKILPILYASREPNVPSRHYNERLRPDRTLPNEKISKASQGLAIFLNQHEDISLSDAEKLFINYFLILKKNHSKKLKNIKVFVINLLGKLLRLIRFESSNIKKYSSKFNLSINDVDKIKLAIISSQASENEIKASRELH